MCKAVSLGPLIQKSHINVPEHDLLFVATQVARAAGLKNPSHAVSNYQRCAGAPAGLVAWGEVRQVYSQMIDPSNTHLAVRNLQAKSWLASEEWVYSMLLKGHAPASEPFRKWVIYHPSLISVGMAELHRFVKEPFGSMNTGGVKYPH